MATTPQDFDSNEKQRSRMQSTLSNKGFKANKKSQSKFIQLPQVTTDNSRLTTEVNDYSNYLIPLNKMNETTSAISNA